MRLYWTKMLPNVSMKVQRDIAMALVQIFYNESTCNYKYISSVGGGGGYGYVPP